MGKYLTEEELFSTLRHSHLPTILVEGKDDFKIYRWIEEELQTDFEVDILPCGCRSVLFSVYQNRSNLKNEIFVADKDIYVYTSVPEKYSDIIFTNGYSIENDLYDGKRIETMFNEQDAALFAKGLDSYVRYYAYQLKCYFNNLPSCLKKSPQEVLHDYELKPEFMPESDVQDVFEYIINKYDLLLRGHSLFQLLNMVLCRKARASKFNTDAVYETCYKFLESSSMNTLKQRIKDSLVKAII